MSSVTNNNSGAAVQQGAPQNGNGNQGSKVCDRPGCTGHEIYEENRSWKTWFWGQDHLPTYNAQKNGVTKTEEPAPVDLMATDVPLRAGMSVTLGGRNVGAEAEEMMKQLFDTAQTSLSAASFLPVIGDAIDLLNAGISYLRGNYGDVTTYAAASMIPFVGGAVIKKGTDAMGDVTKKADEMLHTANNSSASYVTQVNNTNQQTQKKPGLLDRLKSFGNGVKQYTGNFIAELRPAYARNADNIQTTLDVAGMVPVIGEPADLLNGAISAGRGNYAEAGLNTAAAVPFWGTVATGTKWSRKALDGADALADVTKKASQVQSSIPKPGMGNLGNQGPISADTALNSAEKWLGPSYTEIGPKNSGVFRSADGLRQFRMTNSDLDPLGHGAKVEIGPHVHFEALDLHGKVIENMHVPIN